MIKFGKPLSAMAVIATMMGGCGKMGPLERPGPLVGAPSGVHPEATARGSPMRTIDPRNRNRPNTPPF